MKFAFTGALCLAVTAGLLFAEGGSGSGEWTTMPAPSDRVYLCQKRTIRVDGDLSDWDGVRAIDLGKGNVYNTVSLGIERQEKGPRSWHGPEDLSGSVRLSRDEHFLYVGLAVRDDVHVGVPGYSMWKGDSVQMAFDPLNDKTANYGPDDYEYGFALADGEVSRYCWARGMDESGKPGLGPDSIQCAIKRNGCDTIYEFGFPYECLYPFNPAAGALGFNFIVNDTDAAARKGWLQLTPGIGEGKNPSAYYTVVWPEVGKGPRVASKAVTHAELVKRFAAVKADWSALKAAVERIRKERKVDPSYLSASTGVAEVFFGSLDRVMNAPAPDGKSLGLAAAQVKELKGIVKAHLREAEAIVAGTRPAVSSPRYVTGTARVQGGHFVGTVKSGDQIIESYPILFSGFNIFRRTWDEIGRLGEAGFNLVQTETGPWEMMNPDGTIQESTITAFVDFIHRAQRSNVAVDVMLSPHYYPDWMAGKFPFLREWGMQYADVTENWAFLKKYLATFVPRVMDCPGTLSFCLANEPTVGGVTWSNPAVRKKWAALLEVRHGTITNLNVVYGTKYGSFSAVVPPDDKAVPPGLRYDWSCFVQEQFRDWHRFLAEGVHEFAAKKPVHTKFLIDWIILEPNRPLADIPELFAEITNFNGNDGWGGIWGGNLSALTYDLQKSVADKPVYNSENHLIPDYYEGYVDPQWIRYALWYQVLHGMNASAIWAWDRYAVGAESTTELFKGNLLYRPACLLAASQATLDFQRLARELTALQESPARVMILWSGSDRMLRPQGANLVLKVHEAATLLGRRVGFVTERQLEQGRRIDADLLVVPEAVHLSAKAYSELKRSCGGERPQVVFIGDGCLLRDEYGRPRVVDVRPAVTLSSALSGRELWLRLGEMIGFGQVRIAEASGPAWKVEYRTAKTEDGTLLMMVNHQDRTRTVRVKTSAGEPKLTDLVSGEAVVGPVVLEPYDVRLLRY